MESRFGEMPPPFGGMPEDSNKIILPVHPEVRPALTVRAGGTAETADSFRPETGGADSDLHRRMFEKIKNAKIGPRTNIVSAAGEIIKELGIVDGETQEVIVVELGVMANIARNKERTKLGEGKRNIETNREFEALAMKDAAWMQQVGDYIKENRNNPAIIKQFWKDFEDHYGGLDFKHIKNGILAQVAVENLLEEAGAKIKRSTPEEDVRYKMDCAAIIGDKIVPCQVKSLSLNEGSNIELREKFQYVHENMVNAVHASLAEQIKDANEKSLAMKGQGKSLYAYRTNIKTEKDNEINVFREKALPYANAERGFFFVMPSGIKRDEKGNKINLLKDDGTVSEGIRTAFLRRFNKLAYGIDIPENKSIITKPKKRRKK